MTMKPSEIIKNSLYGLRYYPTPFPAHVWDEEFDGVDLDLFAKAIRKIRSTQENFPPYSLVRNIMSGIKADEKIAKPWTPPPTRTQEEKAKAEKRSAAFRKWYRWLNSYEVKTPEIKLQYFEGIAREYSKIGGGRVFLQGVEGLLAQAEEQQKIINQTVQR